VFQEAVEKSCGEFNTPARELTAATNRVPTARLRRENFIFIMVFA